MCPAPGSVRLIEELVAPAQRHCNAGLSLRHRVVQGSESFTLRAALSPTRFVVARERCDGR